MIGIIDVGGGMRAVYGTGALDYLMEHGVEFDYGIGISAGSANIISGFAGQNRRAYRFYTDYAFRDEYMSRANYFRDHNFIDFDYVYDDLSGHDGEDPLDYDAFVASGKKIRIVATNALTAEPHFFTNDDLWQDHYDPVKASCSVPVVNQPYVIDGVPYFDGALSAPIPIRKAFEEGCDKVVIVLTRPLGRKHTEKRDAAFAAVLERKYPAAAEAMRTSAKRYDNALSIALEYQYDGKALIIAPDSIGHMKTLKKDLSAVRALYRKGRRDAKKVVEFLGG